MQWSIVVADDEPAHAEAIRRTLEATLPGARVRVATSLRQYREMVADEHPLVALVDMNLPDGQVTEVLTSPAEDGPFPVLVMTSFGDQKIAVEMLKAGAVDYFPKTKEAFAAVGRIVQRGMREWALMRERKLAQELLGTSEQRYRALFEKANDAIVLFVDENVVECNPAACRLFGVPEAQVLPRHPACLSPEVQPDGRRSSEKYNEHIAEAQEGRPQLFEWQHQRPDGTLFDAEVSLSRLDVAGQPLMQVLVRDITDRKRLQEILAAKNKELMHAIQTRDRFLASMSHELRTPLNAIIGLAGIILMKIAGPLTTAQEEYMHGVKSSAVHLTTIINDLLDVSRLESGHTEVHLETLAPSEVLEEVVASLRPMAEEKHLVLTSAPAPPGVTLTSDRRLLRQILLNLVGNAVKYTDVGSVAVSIEADSTTVSYRVADTGLGIPLEEQGKLFGEFTRLHRYTHPAKEGTGLGLYLSQKMAGLLRGRIEVASKVGEGSVFTLVLAQ